MVFTTLGAGVALAALCFFGGELLAGIFTSDADSIMYAAQYLKGFSADILLSKFAGATLVHLGLGCAAASYSSYPRSILLCQQSSKG